MAIQNDLCGDDIESPNNHTMLSWRMLELLLNTYIRCRLLLSYAIDIDIYIYIGNPAV